MYAKQIMEAAVQVERRWDKDCRDSATCRTRRVTPILDAICVEMDLDEQGRDAVVDCLYDRVMAQFGREK